MNGRSPTSVIELVAKNSRTDSKSRTVLASTPPEAGRSAARMRRHWAKTWADNATSIRRAAASSKWLRNSRITNSKPSSSSAAELSTQRLLMALFGITRSYTAML